MREGTKARVIRGQGLRIAELFNKDKDKWKNSIVKLRANFSSNSARKSKASIRKTVMGIVREMGRPTDLRHINTATAPT